MMINAGKMLYVLSAVSLMLPWFTYDARIMGYCWGYEFVTIFLLPMLLTGAYVFGCRKNGWLSAVGIMGATLNIGVLIYAVGTWHQQHNIASGFLLYPGIRTATLGAWIAALTFLSLLVVTVLSVYQGATEVFYKGR